VVELDPPRGLNYDPILRRAKQLADMGVDAITMADNPVATLHMGNLALASIVQQEAGLPVITHLTCRDHNLLGLQSILLAAHALGLHHLLALTGDPAKVGDQPGATSVYDLNSFGLVELINKFNHGVQNAGMPLGGRTRFCVAVAFNPGGTDRKLAHELTRLRKKVAAGAHCALTQPVYEPARFSQARAAAADLNLPIFAGVMPLLSERNAEFLHNEVPGIVLSDEVRRRMKGFSGKEGRRMGVQIAKELIDAMLPEADGFYLIPPQRFTEMAVELVDHIHCRTADAAA
jgi:methionine synthase / methylenetetrahydrofolate reductase(NADPH)